MSDLSDMELPELSDGALVDLDISPSPWTSGAESVPHHHEPHIIIHADAAAGPDEATPTIDAGVQSDPDPENPEMRAGPPCGVPAQLLADNVILNPGLSATFIAGCLAQRPIDLQELQILTWASEVATLVEQRTAENLLYGAIGALQEFPSRRGVRDWVRCRLHAIPLRPR